MKRAALEKSRTLRTWRTHLVERKTRLAVESSAQPGRFRKSQRIAGCGHVRCWLCHGDKLAGQPTLNDRRAAATLVEGLQEI